MIVPFQVQVSEYDCVPVSFVNALTHLFTRKEIPPIVIQRIYMSCLDHITSKQRAGHGTSRLAIQQLGNWLNSYRQDAFRVNTEFFHGKQVHFKQGNRIAECLKQGGVALLKVKHEKNTWHYILGLSIQDGWIHAFDPYPKTTSANEKGFYEFLTPVGPKDANLRVAREWLDTGSNSRPFRLGTSTERECLLIERA